MLSALLIVPDKSYLPELKSFVQWAKDNHDDDLAVLIQLLKCRLVADNNRDPLNDSIGREMKEMLLTYGKESKRLNAEILQNLGFYYYFFLKRNNLSFEHFLEAYNQYKDIDPEEFPGKRKYIYELSGSYFRFGDYHNTIKYLQYSIATKYIWGDPLTCASYNTIGDCYEARKMYDSALAYYQLGKQAAIDKKDKPWMGISDGNIGNIYFIQKKYELAIQMLEKSVEISLQETQRRIAVNSICIMADAYLMLNKVDKAEQCIQKADSILQNFSYLRNYELTGHLSQVKAKFYAVRGDAKLTLLYADSARIASDSVNAGQIASNQLKTNDREQYVQQKNNTQHFESERQRQELLRNSLIVSILLLMVIAILIISRQRLKHKKLEADKKYAEAELAVATTKLFGFRKSESEKDELIDNFNIQLEQLRKVDEETRDEEVRAQLERAILLTDEQWEQFRDMFEKVHKGFFSRLKNKIPELTQAEVRFLALTKLKLSSKEMAGMLGVSHNTIRSYKFRIRKKMNLDEDFMMDELVNDI